MSPDDCVLVEYLRRSYHAVDGLWFVLVEQQSDFDAALALDQRVWEVLAKVQARKARELTGRSGNRPSDLAECFGLKLAADGHAFDAVQDEGHVRFAIHGCPWVALLRRSSREHLAPRIAEAICCTEGRVWCAEFGGEYEFGMSARACDGADRCEMRFTRLTVVA